MAIAISYKSESGDDYLSIYEGKSISEIIEAEKEKFDEEFAYLYICGVRSTQDLDVEAIEEQLTEAIEGYHSTLEE